jgi:putative multiple sugar transport system substrate-binding protein
VGNAISFFFFMIGLHTMDYLTRFFGLSNRFLGMRNGAPLGAGKPRIGIAMPTQAVDRWIDDGKYLMTNLQAKGYEVDLQYAGDDVLKQISQIQTMIARGAIALVIASINGESLSSVLAPAVSKGIKILAYDRLLTGTNCVDFYVSFDNFQVGVLQAQSLEHCLGLQSGKGPWNIELFGGTADDNNAHLFYAGALSVLQPYLDQKQIVVQSNEFGMEQVSTMRWLSTLAVSRMISLLTKHYQDNRLHAVLSPLDSMSIGILDSLKAMGYARPGRPLPFVTGQDADVESIKSIIAKEQYSTIFKDTRALALLAANVVDELLGGQMPAHDPTQSYDNQIKRVPTRLLQPVLVDASNYQEILIDSGYIQAAALQ